MSSFPLSLSVPSGTVEDLLHEVRDDLRTRYPTCTCKGYEHYDRCRHVTVFVALRDFGKTPTAMRAVTDAEMAVRYWVASGKECTDCGSRIFGRHTRQCSQVCLPGQVGDLENRPHSHVWAEAARVPA